MGTIVPDAPPDSAAPAASRRTSTKAESFGVTACRVASWARPTTPAEKILTFLIESDVNVCQLDCVMTALSDDITV